jgi:hypothetical protein
LPSSAIRADARWNETAVDRCEQSDEVGLSLDVTRRMLALLDAQRLRLPPTLYRQLLLQVVGMLGLGDDVVSEDRIAAAVTLVERRVKVAGRRQLDWREREHRRKTHSVSGVHAVDTEGGHSEHRA